MSSSLVRVSHARFQVSSGGLHWQRVYAEAVFHPGSTAARCAAYVASGDQRSIALIAAEEENRQLKRLAVQLGAAPERVALAQAVARHRTTGA